MTLSRKGTMLMVSLIVCQTAFADIDCRVIHWQPNHVYTIEAGVNTSTHVLMPERRGPHPVVGNSELWQVEAIDRHIYVKAKNKEHPDAQESTLSWMSEQENSYEFILKRVAHIKTPCVIVKRDGALMDKSWQTLSHRHRRGASPKQVKQLTKVYQSNLHNVITQQRLALANYRSTLFTDYSWYRHHPRVIQSVYDDGQWTYVRVANKRYRVGAVLAVVNRKPITLPVKFDARHHTYRVSGIYPSFKATINGSTVTIKRHS